MKKTKPIGVRETQRMMKDLATDLAYREGKQSQAHVAEILGLLGLLCEILWDEPEWIEILQANGQRRVKRKRPNPLIE